jgi:hypothetical protein
MITGIFDQLLQRSICFKSTVKDSPIRYTNDKRH